MTTKESPQGTSLKPEMGMLAYRSSVLASATLNGFAPLSHASGQKEEHDNDRIA